MRSFFDVTRGWQGSVKRIFYYGKKKTKKSKKVCVRILIKMNGLCENFQIKFSIIYKLKKKG